MPDLLEFNPNRDLGFDPNRTIDVDPNRGVLFDPNRDLGFAPDRDLGFGKKGVVFRGFVCPVCGASVTEDQPTCMECGAVFERKDPSRPEAPLPPPSSEESPAPPQPAPPSVATARRPPPPPSVYPQAPKRIDVHNCPFCGARTSTTDAFCWNCGNRMYSQGR